MSGGRGERARGGGEGGGGEGGGEGSGGKGGSEGGGGEGGGGEGGGGDGAGVTLVVVTGLITNVSTVTPRAEEAAAVSVKFRLEAAVRASVSVPPTSVSKSTFAVTTTEPGAVDTVT